MEQKTLTLSLDNSKKNNRMGNNGIMDMLVLDSSKKCPLEDIIERKGLDFMDKLVKIKETVVEYKNNNTLLTKEQYNRLRVSAKELLKEYENNSGMLTDYAKNEVENVFSKLNKYLRQEHKRLQDGIWSRASLELVLSNKKRSGQMVRDRNDFEGRLNDINGYLEYAKNSENNKIRDGKYDIEERKKIKKNYDAIIYEFANIKDAKLKNKFKETLYNVVNYTSNIWNINSQTKTTYKHQPPNKATSFLKRVIGLLA
ncbi:MAG: hypothetical protein QW727_02730 [Candidatus Pacearchaeota archaeon]